jgi:hypothetical protein
VNKCGGDVDTFRQEYPATWQEAFAMSGAMFFDRKGLEWQEGQLETPKRVGEIYRQTMAWEFRDQTDGRIRVYREPVKGDQYLVVLDASEGLTVGDEAAGIVLNKRTNTVDAALNGQYTPEELAEMGISLGNWYNEAMIAPENKGYGTSVCNLIFTRYGNIYRKKKKVRLPDGRYEDTDELGFNTNAVTRPQCLAALNEEIKNRSGLLRDKPLHAEMLTFIQPKDKDGRPMKPEAEAGSQDGLVMCRAIAAKIREEHPYIRRAASTPTDVLRRRRVDELRRTRKNAGFSFK